MYRFTIDHRVQRKRSINKRSFCEEEIQRFTAHTMDYCHRLFTHHSRRQDLVPRSPARVCVGPSAGICRVALRGIHVSGFSGANNETLPAHAATQGEDARGSVSGGKIEGSVIRDAGLSDIQLQGGLGVLKNLRTT